MSRADQENPHNPSRPPIHSTHQRLTFRPVTLQPLDETSATKEKGSETKKAKEKTEEPRSIFMLRPATKGPNKPTETIRSEDLLKTRALERTSPTKHGDSAGTSDKEMPEPELAAGSSRLPEIFDQPVKRSHKKKSSQTLKPQVTRKPRAPRKAASPSAETETQAIAGPSGATLITHDPDAPVKRKGRPKSLFPKPKLVIDNPAELDDLDLDGLAGTTRSISLLVLWPEVGWLISH